MQSNTEQSNRSGILIASGFLIGTGLSGFVDGILLHEILQWHHMFTGLRPAVNLPNIEINTLGDGIFHAANWIITVIGIALLWRAGGNKDVAWSSKIFVGSILIGAGLFDVVEGIIDHQILGIHHVKTGPNELAWDIGFLIFGATVAIVGWLLLRSGKKETSVQL